MALSVSAFPAPLRPVSPENDETSVLLKGLFSKKPESKPSSRRNTGDELVPPPPPPPPPLPPSMAGSSLVFASDDDDDGPYAQVPLHRPEPLPAPPAHRQRQVSITRGPSPPVRQHSSLGRLDIGLAPRPAPTAPPLPVDRAMKLPEPTSSRPLPAVPNRGPIVESSKSAALRESQAVQSHKRHQKHPQSKVLVTTPSRSQGQPSPQPVSVRYQSLAVDFFQNEGSSSSFAVSTATGTAASPIPNVPRPLPRVPAAIASPSFATSPTSSQPRQGRVKRPRTSPSSSPGFGNNTIPTSWASRPVDLNPSHPVAPPASAPFLTSTISRSATRSPMYRTRSRSHTRGRRDRSSDVSPTPSSPVPRLLVNRATISGSSSPSGAGPSVIVPLPSRSSSVSASKSVSVPRASLARVSIHSSASSSTLSRHSSSGSASTSTPATSPGVGLSSASSNRYLSDRPALSVPSSKISEEAAAVLWGARGISKNKPTATTAEIADGVEYSQARTSREPNTSSLSPPRRPQLPRLRTPSVPLLSSSPPEGFSSPAAATIPEGTESNGSVDSPSDVRVFVDDADSRSLLSRSPSPMRYARPSSRGSTASSFSSPSPLHLYAVRPYDYGHGDDDDDDQEDVSRFSFAAPDVEPLDQERSRSRSRKRGRGEQLRAYRNSYRPKLQAPASPTADRSPSPIRYATRRSLDMDRSGEDGVDETDSIVDVDVGMGGETIKRHVLPRSYQFDYGAAPPNEDEVKLVKSSSGSTGSSGKSSKKRAAESEHPGKMNLKLMRPQSESVKVAKTAGGGTSSGSGASVIDITLAGLSLGLVGRTSRDSDESGRDGSKPLVPSTDEKSRIRRMIMGRKSQSHSHIDINQTNESGYWDRVVRSSTTTLNSSVEEADFQKKIASWSDLEPLRKESGGSGHKDQGLNQDQPAPQRLIKRVYQAEVADALVVGSYPG